MGLRAEGLGYGVWVRRGLGIAGFTVWEIRVEVYIGLKA